MRTLTLPPSFLLGGAVSVEASVSYQCLDRADTTAPLEAGDRVDTTVKTTRKDITGAAEYEQVKLVVNDIRRVVRGVTRSTPIGVLCLKRDEAALDEALAVVRALATEHNRTAKFHFVRVTYVKALVVADDDRAARELAFEMRTTLNELAAGIAALDPAAIREAANKAKMLAPVLEDVQRDLVKGAVDEARATASAIVKAAEKGETFAVTVGGKVDVARSAFLDFEIPEEVAVRSNVDAGRFADACVSPDSVTTAAAPVAVRTLEIAP